jgi:hypothetical protein
MPARDASADLQDDLFELAQFLVGNLREIRLDPHRVDLIPSHLDRCELGPLIGYDLAQSIPDPLEQIMPGHAPNSTS